MELCFCKYLRRTAERANCEVLDDGCILDFKGALELHNGPVLAFTAAAFHRNVHLWNVDVDVAKMPLQIFKLNHVRHLMLFKIQEHTQRQAGKGKWKRVNGKGKLFTRAMAGNGGWEDLGLPIYPTAGWGLGRDDVAHNASIYGGPGC